MRNQMQTKWIGFSVVAVLALSATSGCGGSQACHADFSGNYSESADQPAGCTTLTQSTSVDTMGDWLLGISATSKKVPSAMSVQIDVGANAAAGDFSSATVTDWQSMGETAANCELSAGAASVPTGNFTLSLTAASPAPRGTLHIEQYVQAPANVDCGAGDVEIVDITF
jgi:hypothetical protein